MQHFYQVITFRFWHYDRHNTHNRLNCTLCLVLLANANSPNYEYQHELQTHVISWDNNGALWQWNKIYLHCNTHKTGLGSKIHSLIVLVFSWDLTIRKQCHQTVRYTLFFALNKLIYFFCGWKFIWHNLNNLNSVFCLFLTKGCLHTTWGDSNL